MAPAAGGDILAVGRDSQGQGRLGALDGVLVAMTSIPDAAQLLARAYFREHNTASEVPVLPEESLAVGTESHGQGPSVSACIDRGHLFASLQVSDMNSPDARWIPPLI